MSPEQEFFMALAASPSAPEEVRIVAVNTLAVIGNRQTLADLIALYSAHPHPEGFRLALAQAIATLAILLKEKEPPHDP